MHDDSPLRSIKRLPWEPTPEQERMRIRFHEQHPGVGFQRVLDPFPHWVALWMDADMTVTGVTSVDFSALLAEVFDAFGYADQERSEEKGREAASGS